jgi:hypothetical protein
MAIQSLILLQPEPGTATGPSSASLKTELGFSCSCLSVKPLVALLDQKNAVSDLCSLVFFVFK